MKCTFSPTSLNLLMECPRCFWLQMVKGIKRPSGPWASFPLKMDEIIKKYFNKYRYKNQLPILIEGKVPGRLAKNMPYTLQKRLYNGFSIIGKPDDYLLLDDGRIAILEHKIRANATVSVHPAYTLQMDVYSYLLKTLGYSIYDRAFLVYYYPVDSALHDGLSLYSKVEEVMVNPLNAVNLIGYAFRILRGDLPSLSEACEFCRWMDKSDSC